MLLLVLCVRVCDSLSLSLSLQVQRKVGLICRGGSIGLMGKIAGTVHTGGSQVTGYVPLRQSLRRFNLAS
jgi:predicted Rossmann-fold nucleotide-binding protein